MGRATMRVPALASVLFACLALGAAGLARPVVAADDAQPSPAVYHLPKLTALTAGQLHDCGLDVDGRVWCWGSNVNGTLGVGSDEPVDGPVQVDIPDRVTATKEAG